ncbi:unnamed protein product [Penicillium salamii]|nr:unnamed protein product [Penicillium salamii]CAG8184533.1 unnamed protein product [Penicillium salamii]CAG8422179.1 unnamed protein product [Penicillium salamii]
MESTFKVIIIGGGPIGLLAAHALYRAGIDFVLLERRQSIVEEQGASIVLYPQTFRVMHQLGILDVLLPLGTELDHHLSFTKDGKVFNESTRYQRIRENHGYGPVIFHRTELLQAIYECLPETSRSKILTGKALQNIETHDYGIAVSCADGSTFQGSIVIGADGVHSKTRHLMREIALKGNPLRDWDTEQPYKSTFRLLYGAFPASSLPGEGYDVQSSGKSVVYFSGKTRGWFFLYDKLPQPTTESNRYNEKEVEALAGDFADFPLNGTLKVKDLWPNMSATGLTDLQEGIVKHWSLGRIVLVGDSCHKFTTHLGLGFNNGVQDVVVLCNNLRARVRETPNGCPDAETLAQVFQKYETTRKSPECSLMTDLENSGLETRMHTWSGPFYWLLSRYIAVWSIVEDFIFRFGISPSFQKAQVLDFIPALEVMKGKLPWLYPMEEPKL